MITYNDTTYCARECNNMECKINFKHIEGQDTKGLPVSMAAFDKWGCDPKQYHHIIRLRDLLQFRDNPSYYKYPPQIAQELIDIKRNKNNLTKELKKRGVLL